MMVFPSGKARRNITTVQFNILPNHHRSGSIKCCSVAFKIGSMIFLHMRHYLIVCDFSKWSPINVVLVFYTFGEIKQMEKMR